ncbi:hypothetical protein [Dictyobacter aurantiacus]|uniref:Uncharacterized protein n=1 Tax=Dictyobacter aurantiacus TaxID=1936993 RepID=A0A401ZJE5_9CHLR|nr:hypothetical protein [Dictyobacter aurantiacus]GCE06976.1 hypothetical protein KDAU_43050 [Dictyobacter aurantiacus]
METRLLGHERADTVLDVAAWANDLIGKDLPGQPGYRVIKVIQFQLVQLDAGYDAMVLVEVQNEGEFLNLKEADVEAIVDITSAVDDKI